MRLINVGVIFLIKNFIKESKNQIAFVFIDKKSNYLAEKF